MAKEFLLVPKRKYDSMVKSMTEMEKDGDFKDSPHQERGKDASQIQANKDDDNKDGHEDGRDRSEPNPKPLEIESNCMSQPKPLPRLYVKRPLSKMDFYRGVTLTPKSKRKKTNKNTMWINYTI